MDSSHNTNSNEGSPRRAPPSNVCKAYISNLSFNTRDDRLRETFQEIAEVQDAFVVRNRDTQKSRGYGFVTFSSAEHVQEAIKRFNGTELDGRNIIVATAKEDERSGDRQRRPYNGNGGTYRRSNYREEGHRNERYSERGRGGYRNEHGGRDSRRYEGGSGYERRRDRPYNHHD